MTAKLIDGAALAQALRSQYKQRAKTLGASGSPPGLAVVMVGEQAASRVYVRNKMKACTEAGFHAELIERPASLSEAALLALIAQLNLNPAIDGILVQLPLPPQIDSRKVVEAIDPSKDVDGFHPVNAGALLTGTPRFVPCTPAGIMDILKAEGIDPQGCHAVVIGRSNIVGKPLALLLLHAGATVTICHSETVDLAAFTRQADILISAAGRANLVMQNMVKPGACVIDVGINRDANGKLCGDVDFAAVRNVAGLITPVPGGVGPMTIAMLLANTLKSAESKTAESTFINPKSAAEKPV